MDTSPAPDLRSLPLVELEAFVAARGWPKFRAEQIFRWLHSRGARSFAEMTNVSLEAQRTLTEGVAEGRWRLGRLDLATEQRSSDGTRKLAFRTSDDRTIESVVIPGESAPLAGEDEEDDEWNVKGKRSDHNPAHAKSTLCVSSQVGCALDCKFCATATLGFGRHLEPGEMVDQVYQASQLLAGLPADDATRQFGSDHITNLVFMGMGEPLHNYEQLKTAVSILVHPLGAHLSKRKITVSTAGLVPAMEKFADDFLGPMQVNMAISLNASNDEVRSEIMPINKKWNIAALLGAARKVASRLDRKRRITFEYVLLADVNDSVMDARRLASLLSSVPSKINLIPWNPHPGAPYGRPPLARVLAFQEELRQRGFAVYIRWSRGDDIDAACGQLAAKTSAPTLVALKPRKVADSIPTK